MGTFLGRRLDVWYTIQSQEFPDERNEMILEYHSSMRKQRTVEVTGCDDPDYISVTVNGKTESFVNHLHGLDGESFRHDVPIEKKLMEILKYLWLFEHPRNWRVKQCFDKHEDAWAPGRTPAEQRQIKVNLDHNAAAFKRLGLSRNGVLEELWGGARDRLEKPKR